VARSSNHRNGALNAVSPHSMAYFASRSRCARQTCQRTPWPRWLPSMSDTHTSGWMAPNSAVTTALPRLGERARERGWITCSTTSSGTSNGCAVGTLASLANVPMNPSACLPPVLAFDPHRGLVRADHRAGEHDFLDRCRGIQQRLPRPGQDVAYRALADRQ